MSRLISDIEEFLTIEPCNCGRSYCKFFSGLLGPRGESFSIKDIEWIISDLEETKKQIPKSIKHLKKLLS